jgi:DNA-binding GntR family transcriptional regulator
MSPNATLADIAYGKLRADLLACRIAPGAAIRINEASATLGINTIAVREALSKLTSEGLVTAEAQKGFRAAPISAVELRDLTRARIEIECLCLRISIENGNVEWETGIVAALHRLLRTAVCVSDDPKRNNDDWVVNHRLFHEALANGCGNPLLLEFRAMLFAKAERYRRLSVPLASFDRNLDLEHKQLADAVLARDVSLAANLIAAHLQTTANIVLLNDEGLSAHKATNVLRSLSTS